MAKKRTKEQISYTMSRIRSKDTSIELLLRKALWKSGLRYRKHYKKATGVPDVALVSSKIAIFCDSSFWHGRNWDERKNKIFSNREYWIRKIERNIERDKATNAKLKLAGWIVLRFWDIDIQNNLEKCVQKITKIFEKTKCSSF